MGLYIKNWSLADWKELLKWAKIGANNAMIGEFTEVEEVQAHGRLIDADAILQEATKGEEPFDWIDKNELLQLFFDAPTILEAEEGE